MDKEKSKPLTVRANIRTMEMLEAIQNELGLKTISGTIFYCIGEIYRRTWPPYSVKRGGSDSRDPEEIARQKIAVQQAEKKAKEEIMIAECTNVCEVSLHGELVDKPDGLYCKFNTYRFGTPDVQNVPIEMCTPEFAKHQQVDQKKK